MASVKKSKKKAGKTAKRKAKRKSSKIPAKWNAMTPEGCYFPWEAEKTVRRKNKAPLGRPPKAARADYDRLKTHTTKWYGAPAKRRW